ncbi:uncharacterized protein J4E84_006265 [Alternaria hordeiaustralica]|uniref:uncharacterized protein n=1 Tax=Alternaria hordeiaustralica TaxID=1187925 RepID=UPI0020C2AD37|nr:uncharacterized protein J4E84_006265 [Alternaria hordeiaustralica]KAI4685537.1 hypothetical protein J4E84_006265 [Alternaria hordeiaustralica]
MRLLTWVTWLSISLLGAVDAAASDTSGVVEVDLVFPRNDTYAPAPYVPIVFAVQNPELASSLSLRLGFEVWNMTNGSKVDEGSFGDYYESSSLNWTNTSSSDPELVYRHYTEFNTEGKWSLVWNLIWSNCTYDPLREIYYQKGQSQTSGITFTTKKTAQGIDLVDATKNQSCSENQGIAFNVVDTTKVTGGSYGVGEQCAVLDNSTVTPTPCRVNIDSTAASSITAALTASLCSDEYRMWVEAGRAQEPEISCPADESAAQQLLVGGITCLIAAIGALSYLLA